MPTWMEHLQGLLGSDVDWKQVAAYKPFGGVRIEDDVLVTADGHRNLTREEFARQAV